MTGILYTQLTPREIEYLEILQEECAEVIQAISKMKRFGLYSSNPKDENPIANIDHFVTEIGDVLGMIVLLSETGVGLNQDNLTEAMQHKMEKVKKYLQT